MKGVIFNLLEEVVVTSHGEDVWESLLERAGSSGAYTSLGSYDDADLTNLVRAASEALELTPRQVLRWVGQQAMPLMMGRWPGFFSAHQHTARFLRSLNEVIHPEVRKLYAGAACPHFGFGAHPDGTLRMEYRSSRKLCALAHGFIDAAAVYYREVADVRHLACMHEGDPSCVMAVSLVPAVCD